MNFKEQYLTKNTNIYFISEIGINHNGIFDLAITMIEKSKKVGASAVKFQKRDADCLLLAGTKLEIPTGYLSKDADDIPDESKAFGTWTYPDTRLEFTDEGTQIPLRSCALSRDPCGYWYRSSFDTGDSEKDHFGDLRSARY